MRSSRSAPRPLAELIGGAIAESCARRGLASVEIVTHWAEIAGEPLAGRAVPLKLAWPSRREEAEPGVLHVRVEGAYAIELQHASPVLIDRINRYFGWRCVGRIALRQGPMPVARQQPAAPAEPDAADCARIAGRLGPFEDEALARAVARLGALVARRK